MPAAGRSINVREFIDERRVSPFQWLVGFLAFLIISLDGWDTVIIGFAVPELIREWGVTKQALAPILSAALFGLALGAFVGGPVADRFGRKRVLTTSVFIIGIGTLATAYATSLGMMLPIRFVTGLGLGAVMPNVVALWSEYVPERRRSFLVTVCTVGSQLAPPCADSSQPGSFQATDGAPCSWSVARLQFFACLFSYSGYPNQLHS
ncbi:MFS transporter [Paraburkholderia sp. SEWSISQ10-3 4]|nr:MULTISPECIES: MFS transporter [Paraburkholderia]MCX4138260.1 MFS transporter [Paraburkholderia aspalathi]MDN7170950.1 MFS transporter [Paraburkholderia sp. SEWSISQ10-3 4]MDQ6500589.1 MFS transporter [Paraburkholderia aspalathi]